jgi:hypothetical protein
VIELVKEFWRFLKERKKFWMVPIVLVLGAVGTLLFLAEGSAVAPFIYSLF